MGDRAGGGRGAGARLDELHRLRTSGQIEAVVSVAEELWEACSLLEPPEPGLAAACQITFIALMDAGRPAHAQLWRARATIEASRAGELNTAAMLAVPLAFAAMEVAATDEEGPDRALEILAELGRAAALLGEGWSGPGVSLEVLQRARLEKSGYACWRAARYGEAADWYGRARRATQPSTRDRLRIDGGDLLCELGRDQDERRLDPARAAARFDELRERGEQGGWIDVAQIFAANAERLRAGVCEVQDLLPVEVERRSPGTFDHPELRRYVAGRTDVLDTIYRRRTSRVDYVDRPVPERELRDVLRAGCSAPSSKNAQPWRFHVVRDADLLEAIADAASNAEGWDTYVPRDPATGRPRTDWESTVRESADVLRIVPACIFVENLGAFSGGRASLASTTTERRAGSLVGYTFEVLGLGAAIENMVLAAQSLGIQTAFMGDLVIAEDLIRAELAMEGDLVGVLALGYSKEVVHPRDHLADVQHPAKVVWHS